jgi:hypothetical protein|tara:strand:+ start:388 stop:594 length:207 start_codon:yes stop_codon:yes gene_type:complete
VVRVRSGSGFISARRTSARIEICRSVVLAAATVWLNVEVFWTMPPARMAPPRTSSVLERMDPSSETFR